MESKMSVFKLQHSNRRKKKVKLLLKLKQMLITLYVIFKLCPRLKHSYSILQRIIESCNLSIATCNNQNYISYVEYSGESNVLQYFGSTYYFLHAYHVTEIVQLVISTRLAR